MDDREMLTRFIKEVIEESNGIYTWSWFHCWDDFKREKIIENNPNLWRERILRNDWMINSPGWNVFIVGMYVLNDDEEVRLQEDLKFLVDKTMTIERFITDYQRSLESPIYIKWVHVLGKDGFLYWNFEEPEGPFEFLDYDEKWVPNVSEDEMDMAYYQELANSIKI